MAFTAGPAYRYADGLLGPFIILGVSMGMVIAPSFNTGTFGVAPRDAGVASATVTVGQQLGASVGTALFNTSFATALASYNAAHPSSLGADPQALAHAYDTTFCGSPRFSLLAPSSAALCCAVGRCSAMACHLSNAAM